MKIVSAGLTDVGRVRSSNEDHFGVFDDLRLYIVADGMGGHAAGEVASRLAVETVRDAFQDATPEQTVPIDGSYDVGRRLVWAIEHANQTIFQNGSEDPELTGMGTTVVALWFDADSAFVAHVGDSRIYRLRGGVLEQLTSDHSLVNDYMSRGVMTADEAAVHPMKHVLVRALGTTASVAVDIQRVLVEPDDVFLLCSDGLSNVVPSDQLSTILATARKVDLDATCQELVDTANKRGGLDNITVVVVRSTPDS